MINRREIGLKLDGDGFTLVSLDLGKGTTHEVFQTEGTSAVAIDMLNGTGAMLPATPLSIFFVEMLSGPFDLD